MHSILPGIDPANNASFIDQEARPVRESFFRENAVKAADFAIRPVGQKPVLSPQFLGELPLTGACIDADGQDLRAVFREILDISLIPCQLGPSAAGKGEHVEREHHVFVALVLTQGYVTFADRWQLEIGGCFTNFCRHVVSLNKIL